LRRRLRQLDELPGPSPGQARDVLGGLVVVKLNGGLGTGMGLSGPKSLLEVKPGTSFLDVLATQVLALRERRGVRLPFVLMNSATTRGPSLDCLRRYDGLRVPGVPLDFLQGREPKIRADDLQPVQWPAGPELEWCPPGHGGIYTALAATGTLGALRSPRVPVSCCPIPPTWQRSEPRPAACSATRTRPRGWGKPRTPASASSTSAIGTCCGTPGCSAR
jgi:UTP--glucose-1-phosphate uridylyltransferase